MTDKIPPADSAAREAALAAAMAASKPARLPEGIADYSQVDDPAADDDPPVDDSENFLTGIAANIAAGLTDIAAAQLKQLHTDERLAVAAYLVDRHGLSQARAAAAIEKLSKGKKAMPRKTGNVEDFEAAAARLRASGDKASAEKSPGPDWMLDCQKNKSGDALSNLANAVMPLRRDAAFRGVIYFDEMRRCVMLCKPIPEAGKIEQADSFSPRPATDADIVAIQEWLQLAGIKNLAGDTVHSAVDLVARENPEHPVRNYLSGLKHDGIKRLDTWLCDYLGADDDKAGYVRTIGRLFPISMVARVMKPGCKVDYMLVLEGPQGAQKSTACKVLTGEEFFSDSMPENVGSKDAALHLRGKWCIEMAEMHALSKSETTALKAFLTRTTDIYRPPYGRLEVHDKRQCVFIGSTNADTYLKDETGGRRFWPVKCGVINIAGLTAARDQLFAEAMAAYQAGDQWWPEAAFEREHIAPQQASRYMADAWQEPIAQYLETKDRVRVIDVALEALGIATERVGTAEQRRIMAVMQSLGWSRGKRTGDGRWWEPVKS